MTITVVKNYLPQKSDVEIYCIKLENIFITRINGNVNVLLLCTT